jgi:hypothetical protein
VPENEFGNGSDDSFSVGTGDEQNCVLVHRQFKLSSNEPAR